MNTPWGPSQDVERLAHGILWISTASHGGFFVPPEPRRIIPASILAKTIRQQGCSGWFEEDLDWSIVVHFFPEVADSDQNRAFAERLYAERYGDLPAGWSESRPGGLATNMDQQTGGIVDREIASGKWFAIPHREGAATLTGFGTRAEAIAALLPALNVLRPYKVEATGLTGYKVRTPRGEYCVKQPFEGASWQCIQLFGMVGLIAGAGDTAEDAFAGAIAAGPDPVKVIKA